jgi:hypothetical protein
MKFEIRLKKVNNDSWQANIRDYSICCYGKTKEEATKKAQNEVYNTILSNKIVKHLSFKITNLSTARWRSKITRVLRSLNKNIKKFWRWMGISYSLIFFCEIIGVLYKSVICYFLGIIVALIFFLIFKILTGKEVVFAAVITAIAAIFAALIQNKDKHKHKIELVEEILKYPASLIF